MFDEVTQVCGQQFSAVVKSALNSGSDRVISSGLMQVLGLAEWLISGQTVLGVSRQRLSGAGRVDRGMCFQPKSQDRAAILSSDSPELGFSQFISLGQDCVIG